MRKVKFIKTKYDVCICLDNSLFKNESEKIIKIIKILELFSYNIERYEGTIFINVKDKPIFDDLYNLNCAVELIDTTKDLFKRDKEKEYKLIFKNNQIEQLINFFLKNDITFEGYGYKNNNEFLLTIVINDHDGSYITFNDKIFIKDNYKQLINEIFKN
ncbi:MAG: hypothetical protein SOZ32_03815 [Bacilli bacterium]|nr:hypothetical protein [Bacilli bacterium]